METDEKIFELGKELRHDIHKNPELSENEKGTIKRIKEFLALHTNLEIVDMGTWLYAIYKSKEAKKDPIAFRAELDALPIDETTDIPYKSIVHGVSHKCGHDGHAATLASFALHVENTEADRDVYFIFQHAEETGQGAKVCAEIIDKAKISEIYAWHNISGIPFSTASSRTGTLCCASKGMEIEFTGVSAHASTPEHGINPSFAIAHIVNSIPSLISQEQYKGLVLCTVIQIDVGERAFGVSAHKGRLLLTIRAQYEDEMNILQRKIENLAIIEAQNFNLKYKFGFHDEFPETANENTCLDKLKTAFKELSIPYIELKEPIRSSEDFGFFLKKTKGAMFWLGNGENYPTFHTPEFNFIDEQIPIAMKIMDKILHL